MPRYFFHVFHGNPQFDSSGEELPDENAAWNEAILTTGRILQDIGTKLNADRPWRMEVTDEFANSLFSIHIRAEGR